MKIEIDEPWTDDERAEWAEAWEQGYTACHNDSIRNTITPNPYKEKP